MPNENKARLEKISALLNEYIAANGGFHSGNIRAAVIHIEQELQGMDEEESLNN